MPNPRRIAGSLVYAAATPAPYAAVVADQDGVLAAVTGKRLMGVAVVESAGTPAAATGGVYAGATVSGGTLLWPLVLAASEAKSWWFGPDGIDISTGGVSIGWTSGQFDIVLFYKVVS